MDRRAFLAAGAASSVLAPAVRAADAGAPSTVAPLTPAQLVDLEPLAKRALGEGPFAWIASGAGAEWTLNENRRALERWAIAPEYLAGRANAPDLRVRILGDEWAAPLFTAPMGVQALIHATAEIGMCEGTHAAGLLMTMSGASSHSIEQVARATPGPKWYQLYMPADPGLGRALLQRARDAGFKAVVFTLDALGPGNSEAVTRLGFNVGPIQDRLQAERGATPSRPTKSRLSWADLEFVQKESGLPVILKSVLTPELARRGVSAGAAAIQVSNHGGRQIDGVPAALDVLPGIAEAVGGRVPVLFDSGVRRGVDAFKALALGADAVGIGRPCLYALALGGGPGVHSLYDKLKAELTTVMQGAGIETVAEIAPKYVMRAAG